MGKKGREKIQINFCSKETSRTFRSKNGGQNENRLWDFSKNFVRTNLRYTKNWINGILKGEKLSNNWKNKGGSWSNSRGRSMMDILMILTIKNMRNKDSKDGSRNMTKSRKAEKCSKNLGESSKGSRKIRNLERP